MKTLAIVSIAVLLASCNVPIAVQVPEGSFSYGPKSGLVLKSKIPVIREK